MENEDFINVTESEAEFAPQTVKEKRFSWLQVFAWTVIFLGIAAAAFVLDGLIFRDHLREEWSKMTQAQGQVIASLVTVYAAALAGIVGPAILGSKFNELDQRIEALDDRMNLAARDVEELTSHMRSSFGSIRTMLQQSAGIQVEFTEHDLHRKGQILIEMREKAAELSKAALDKSRKWQSTIDLFKGMHPGKANYVNLLLKKEVIDDVDHAHFMKIFKSKDLKDHEIDDVVLNDLRTSLLELEAWYG